MHAGQCHVLSTGVAATDDDDELDCLTGTLLELLVLAMLLREVEESMAPVL